MILNQVKNIQFILQKWVDGMMGFPDDAEADELLANQFDNLMEVEAKWKSNSKMDEL